MVARLPPAPFGGNNDGEHGTWIYDTAKGNLTSFAGVHPLWLAWSPSGDRIAAVLPKNGHETQDQAELVLHDTGGIEGGPE